MTGQRVSKIQDSDDEGKFTYKNGGSSNSNPLLLGGVQYNEKKENREDILYNDNSFKDNLSNYRNKLLDFLGDNLEREEILYSNISELENKIIQVTVNKIDDLKEKLNNIIRKLSHPGMIYSNQSQKVLNEAQKWNNALGDFARNYEDMIDANTIGGDKYLHAKANCQAAQRGRNGEIISYVLSTYRELEEGTRKVVFRGENLFEQLQDAREDIQANNEGRNLGKLNPNINCKYLLNDRRPNGLDDKY